MKVIVWVKTYSSGNEEHKVYFLKDKTDQELKDALRELWEREVNAPEYDIDAYIEDTWFEQSDIDADAQVMSDDWTLHMWTQEVKEELQ